MSDSILVALCEEDVRARSMWVLPTLELPASKTFPPPSMKLVMAAMSMLPPNSAKQDGLVES